MTRWNATVRDKTAMRRGWSGGDGKGGDGMERTKATVAQTASRKEYPAVEWREIKMSSCWRGINAVEEAPAVCVVVYSHVNNMPSFLTLTPF